MALVQGKIGLVPVQVGVRRDGAASSSGLVVAGLDEHPRIGVNLGAQGPRDPRTRETDQREDGVPSRKHGLH